MIGALVTLVGLMAAAFAYVVFICRNTLAAEFKAWRGGYEIDFDALGSDLNEGVQDINFRGRP